MEALTPEQVHHALIEVFRRRGARSREDLRPKLRQRILKAYEASGLSPDDYTQRVHGKDEEVNQLTRDALAEASARAAREDALLRTFEASGKSINEFADMYGPAHPRRQPLAGACPRPPGHQGLSARGAGGCNRWQSSVKPLRNCAVWSYSGRDPPLERTPARPCATA